MTELRLGVTTECLMRPVSNNGRPGAGATRSLLTLDNSARSAKQGTDSIKCEHRDKILFILRRGDRSGNWLVCV
jgi:hypothetical protein